MLSDTMTLQSPGMTSGTSGANTTEGSTTHSTSVTTGRPHAKSLSGVSSGTTNFPPPKTDKPRPHVCGTCGRSFARLEHLKRHERSHTKEKPFECPECTRCFARRDLLLRHQQKLHMTTTPSSRPRTGRRESTSSSAATASGRVRKNSVANNSAGNTGGSMRPRANTISHVDNATLGMIAAANSAARQSPMNIGQNQQTNYNPLRGPNGFEFRGMSSAAGHHGNPLGLPKLETQGLNIDLTGSLRTAPPYASFDHNYGMDNMLFTPGTTINPAQLHFTDSPHALTFDTPTSPFSHGFPGMPSGTALMDEDGNFEWMSGFDHQMSFANGNEHAIAASSPSAISTGSPSGISEVMLDGSNNPSQTSSMWQNSMLSQAPLAEYPMDLSGSTFPDLLPGPLSAKTVQEPLGAAEQYFSSPPLLASQSPMTPMHGLPYPYFHPPMVTTVDTPTTSAASERSSNRQSSVTSVSTDSITEATRQALLLSLSQPSVFSHNQRKYSQPTISSPLSPGFSVRPRSGSSVSMPSTYDLQRYVAAYIQYFHPHLPFLHIPSLSFDSPAFSSTIRPMSGHPGFQQPGIVGGGGCLILSMAAIGALYEFDNAASKELFEMAKRMIQLYLEERRKADVSAVVNGSNPTGEIGAQNTPLWLVQAMLLNVIYGHNCGDKTSADIASTHCAALVSLARAAELAAPYGSTPFGLAEFSRLPNDALNGEDTRMSNDGWQAQYPHLGLDDHSAWHNWKNAEERKRTLYAVFILSSMLVSAYNHAPALTNSEIRLDLPCDEDLWAAESPEAWYGLGGSAIAEQKATPFSTALSSLLTASQRQQYQHHHMSQAFAQPFGLEPDLPASEIQPSTFGCLILINALHNYIWETRQRHLGRQWTSQETESMHAHIEPALAAWQAAWASNPHHRLERPNPFGCGPLSADSIPLLDLAYVRLFVNLGRSKEAFWQRDFDGMADELARGAEIIQHADHSPASTSSNGDSSTGSSSKQSQTSVEASFVKLEQGESPDLSQRASSPGQTTKRERHLRKAAFHAAHSLSLSDKLGVTFADFNSRELPMQSALCAFDCAQVLAEWVSTLQERVGRDLGILGKDEINLNEIPAMMYVEPEDTQLLEKINQILDSAEVKMTMDNGVMGATTALTSGNNMQTYKECGYGSKILMVTAYMLNKAAVWPVTRLMARSLETQAAHMKERAEKSIIQSD